MNLRLQISLLFLTFIVSVSAETIKGRIINDDARPLPDASCLLFSMPDSVFTGIAQTDSNGYFEFVPPRGLWLANVVCTGYHSKEILLQDYVNCIKESADSTMTIKLHRNELKELVVKVDKGELTMKNGVLTVTNLDEIRRTRILSSSFDLLSAIPLINSFDGNSLSIAGAVSGTLVYVNGRKLPLSDSEMTEYLKNLPSEQIERVEIIYTPDPKWKTTNSVINVILRKANKGTLNGQLTSSTTVNPLVSEMAGFSIFSTISKLKVYLGYNFNYRVRKNKESSIGLHSVKGQIYEICDTLSEQSIANLHNVYANFEYQFNQVNSISLIFSGNYTPRSSVRGSSFNTLYNGYQNRQSGSSSVNAVNMTYSNSGGIDLGIEYTSYRGSRYSDVVSDIMDVALTGESSQTVHQLRAYADCSVSLPRLWTLTYGGSFQFVRNGNDLYNVSTDPLMGSAIHSSIMNEKIADLYLGCQRSFLDGKFSINVSVKGQLYYIGDYTATQLQPTVVATYFNSPTHIFQAAFQRYDNFPSYWQRQDYISYVSPYQLNEGNPQLKPATYNVGSFIYLFKQRYSLVASYYRISNFFLKQSYQSPDALVTITKPYNVDFSELFDCVINIPIGIGKLLYSNFSLTASFERCKSSDWHGLKFDLAKFSGAIMLENTFTISQKPKISLGITGMYKLPSIAGLWQRGHAWLLNANVATALCNENLVIRLQGNDLLQTLIPEYRIDLETQHLRYNSNYYRRSITLSVTYKFRGYKDKRQKDIDTSRFGID